jgi:SAM-dependent methyltransferase
MGPVLRKTLGNKVMNTRVPNLITHPDVEKVFRTKHGELSHVGWGPRLRQRFSYFNPDEHYEAVVDKLVTPGCAWLDVGCGPEVFPDNVKLAQLLSNRCQVLVGIDPDGTLEENSIVHEKIRSTVEEFQTSRLFDLITLRMVAEHIADPDRAVSALSRLTKSGAKVVVYTVNRFAPVSLVSAIIPFRFHNPIKRTFWQTDENDTFPVFYRMNTRNKLVQVFEKYGFKEFHFEYLDDCRTFARFRSAMIIELYCWRMIHALGFPYPENCLLGVYERS